MLTEKDYCDLDTSHELWVMGLEPEAYYDGPLILLYEAQKWLREEMNIDVLPRRGYKKRRGYQVAIHINYNRSIVVLDNDGEDYDSYEEALSEGIKEAIKILKENGYGKGSNSCQ